MRPDLCFVISHGFAARMVLHSALLQHLHVEGASVAVVTPNAGERGLELLAQRFGLHVEPVPALSGTRRFSELLRPYLFEDVRRNPALWAKHQRVVRTGGARKRWSARGRLALNRLLRRVPPLQRTLARVERQALQSPAVDAVLERLRPRAVVSTYPVNLLESSFLWSAREAGIFTIGQLLSWDNISCKGRFSVVPDAFLSWGPIMTEELEHFYGVPRVDVREVGVPHFDAHVQAPDAARRRALLDELGLDPARPYLFFGMSAPFFAPHEIEIVEWMAARVRSGAWGGDLQLVVRPHPQNVRGSMADLRWLPRLDALRSARVAVDIPKIASTKLMWDMDPSDLARLANLVSGAAVTFNTGSTLAIDAIVQDRPVVLTPFDAGTRLPWWQSARRVTEFPHLRKLIALGGVCVTRSFEELDGATRRYLANPEADAQGRAVTRERELHAVDGKASERAAHALLGLVEERRP